MPGKRGASGLQSSSTNTVVQREAPDQTVLGKAVNSSVIISH